MQDCNLYLFILQKYLYLDLDVFCVKLFSAAIYTPHTYMQKFNCQQKTLYNITFNLFPESHTDTQGIL